MAIETRAFTEAQIRDLALLDRVVFLSDWHKKNCYDPEKIAYKWLDPKTKKTEYEGWTPQLGFGLWTLKSILIRRLIAEDLEMFAEDISNKYQ